MDLNDYHEFDEERAMALIENVGKEDFGASLMQRKLRIGCNRAMRLLERLEAKGVICKAASGFQYNKAVSIDEK